MDNFNKLYRDLIIKYYRNPVNKGLIQDSEFDKYFTIKKKNIACSDEIILQVKLDKDVITDIKYEAQGCIILQSSASLMSVYLKNIEIKTAIKKINNFCDMLENKLFDKDILEEELQIFSLVKGFPGRFVCASMPWSLLLEVLESSKQ
ncbi:Fe-S cluster assembly sulfur transfer protein SufU ['Camptotheca acuminata' phytoplasma]|uniref:Fe-S cluster assembly sulfur transfer protein SufU n=1 Tax='Camptotheca acuminata' phytoplasma TaxID=3239192 RepID=UPI00351AB120